MWFVALEKDLADAGEFFLQFCVCPEYVQIKLRMFCFYLSINPID